MIASCERAAIIATIFAKATTRHLQGTWSAVAATKPILKKISGLP